MLTYNFHCIDVKVTFMFTDYGCFCFSLTSLYVGCKRMTLGGQNLLSRVYNMALETG